MNYKQKAAMFGLDARIALTIFVTLSLITGAALFSAIKTSKVVAHANNFNEVVKAIEQYQLDTKEYIEIFNIYNVRLEALLTNYYNHPGWNGPYLDTSIFYLSAYGGLGYKTKSGPLLIRVKASNSSKNYCQVGAQDCNLSLTVYCQNTGGGPGKVHCDNEDIPLLENYGYTYYIESGGYSLRKEKVLPYFPFY